VLPEGPTEASGSARALALGNFVAAVQAADEEPERQSFEPYGDGSQRHLLERPMQVQLHFYGTVEPQTLVADVLDYGENGARLSVALPPKLAVRVGERGELRLLGPGQGSDPPLPFTLQRLEPGSMVKLAEMVLDVPRRSHQ
jgi:hypothetical protein